VTAANGAPAVELRVVDKWFRQVHAARRVHLSVPPGSVHGIDWENAVGKATLKNILDGFFRADRGQSCLPASLSTAGAAVTPSRPESA